MVVADADVLHCMMIPTRSIFLNYQCDAFGYMSILLYVVYFTSLIHHRLRVPENKE